MERGDLMPSLTPGESAPECPLTTTGTEESLGLQTSDSDWSDIETDDEGKNGLQIDLGPDEGPNVLSLDTLPSCHSPVLKAEKSPVSSVPGSKKKQSSIEVTPQGKPSGIPKRNKSRKRRTSNVAVPTDVLDAIAEAKGDSLDLRLDIAAKKMRLNRTQVKSVLRRLVESPELVNLVLEKAGDKQVVHSSPKVEPRITRKLARTVVDRGGKLNWFLEKVAKTPKVVTAECLSLMEEEFPEDEDDQEYDPRKDPTFSEAVASDDGDSVATVSETGTPCGLSSAKTPPPGQPCPTVIEDSHSGDDGRHFKHPSVQSLSGAVRCLDFDFAGTTGTSPLRPSCNTRSKASLKEVTIEELETQFQPPDVTPDMYDCEQADDFDDYALFLAETFGQPPCNKPDEELEVEEAVTDPDFIYQDIEEHFDEFKNNRSTKIPQKEVDALMQELFDAYELDKVTEMEQPNEHTKGKAKEVAPDVRYSIENYPQEAEEVMTVDQRQMVAQQMRQHIQLITQMCLMTAKDQYWEVLHSEGKQMLSDLVSQSFNCQYSVFAQDNLFPSLQAIEDWSRKPETSSEVTTAKNVERCDLSVALMEFMHDKPIFIYPKLLPTSGLAYNQEKTIMWSAGEDQLLSIMLKENDELPKKAKLVKYSLFTQATQRFFMNKTPAQVNSRFKNQMKLKKLTDSSTDNKPILHYSRHKEVLKFPDFSNYIPYDSSNVLTPKQTPPSMLPTLWRDFLKKCKSEKEVGACLPAGVTLINQQPPPPPVCTVATAQVLRQITVPAPASLSLPSMPLFISPIKLDQSLNVVVVKDLGESSQQNKRMPKYRKLVKKQKSFDVPVAKTPAIQTVGNRLVPLGGNPDDVVRSAANLDAASKFESFAQQDILLKETKTQLTILDEAMEACGLNSQLADGTDLYTNMKDFSDFPPPTPDNKTEECDNFNNHSSQEEATMQPTSKTDAEGDRTDVTKEDLNSSNKRGKKQTGRSSAQSQDKARDQTLSDAPSVRKTKSQRDAESALNVLQRDTPTEEAAKRELDCMEIILHAKELLPPENLKTFYLSVCKYEEKPARAFMELHTICQGYPSLQEMLLDVLTPEEALSLGNFVYTQHCRRNDAKLFFEKLKKMFPNQPGLTGRVIKEMQVVLSKNDANVQDLRLWAGKTFKSHQLLHDEFVSMLPDQAVTETLLPCSPERVSLSDHDDDDEKLSLRCYERVHLPTGEEEKVYGNENCPCSCHPLPGVGDHCVHCAIRFINGKVFLKDGKTFKRVLVEYPDGVDNPFSKNDPKGREFNKGTRKRPKSTNLSS